jgi:hypothetical protein
MGKRITQKSNLKSQNHISKIKTKRHSERSEESVTPCHSGGGPDRIGTTSEEGDVAMGTNMWGYSTVVPSTPKGKGIWLK